MTISLIVALESNEICIRYYKNQARPMNLFPFPMMCSRDKIKYIWFLIHLASCLGWIFIWNKKQVHWTRLILIVSIHISFRSRGPVNMKWSSVFISQFFDRSVIISPYSWIRIPGLNVFGKNNTDLHSFESPLIPHKFDFNCSKTCLQVKLLG